MLASLRRLLAAALCLALIWPQAALAAIEEEGPVIPAALYAPIVSVPGRMPGLQDSAVDRPGVPFPPAPLSYTPAAGLPAPAPAALPAAVGSARLQAARPSPDAPAREVRRLVDGEVSHWHGAVPRPGDSIGEFVVDELLGAGGMSTVLKVHGPDGGSHALKLALGNTGNGISPEDAGAALRGEFLLLQKLNRAGVPNIPEPRAYEQSHEPPYLVEEYFPGQTLEQRLNRGRMGEGEAVGVISALLDTLEAMHRKGVGVIYRDLKPGNVILSESGAKLIDFGAGRKLKPGQKSDTVALGTPGFAAPEQWGKSQTDARSDVYSAGWLLYTMVTGLEPPPQFGRPDAKAMRGVSPAVQAAIEKATRLGPELRFQSAGEFKRALERTAILPQAALGSPIQLGFIKNPAATRRKPLLREKASEMHWTSGGKAGLGAAVGVVVWMGCLFSGYVDPSSTSLLKFLFDGLALTTTSAGLAAPNYLAPLRRWGMRRRGKSGLESLMDPGTSAEMADFYLGLPKQPERVDGLDAVYRESLAAIAFWGHGHTIDDQQASSLRELLCFIVNKLLSDYGTTPIPALANYISLYRHREITPQTLDDLLLLAEFTTWHPEAAKAVYQTLVLMMVRRSEQLKEGLEPGATPLSPLILEAGLQAWRGHGDDYETFFRWLKYLMAKEDLPRRHIWLLGLAHQIQRAQDDELNNGTREKALEALDGILRDIHREIAGGGAGPQQAESELKRLFTEAGGPETLTGIATHKTGRLKESAVDILKRLHFDGYKDASSAAAKPRAHE